VERGAIPLDFFFLNPFHASFINYLVHKFSPLLLAWDEFEAEAQMTFITVLPIHLYIILWKFRVWGSLGGNS
jgi:hypothetical protein